MDKVAEVAAPGATEDDPYCIDCYCPSFFVCRRACSEPYQGEPGTVSIMSMPDKQLGGLACSWFEPREPNPIATHLGETK